MIDCRTSHSLDTTESRLGVATKEDLACLGRDVAELRGKISNLPATWQIIGILSALLVGIASPVYARDSFMGKSRAPAAIERPTQG